jgi:hypothetical protein
MQGSRIWLWGKELLLEQMKRSSVLQRPITWMVFGGIGLVALAPGWFGVYGTAWWIRPATWGTGLIVIISVAKGSLNYVNGRSFWSGAGKFGASAFSKEIELLSRRTEDSRLAIAFMDWAARTHLRVELSPEQRENLHQEIRYAIAHSSVEDFFGEEKAHARRVISEAERSLAEVQKKQEEHSMNSRGCRAILMVQFLEPQGAS